MGSIRRVKNRVGNNEYCIPGKRTKRTYYNDYDVSVERVNQIKHYCRTTEDHSLIWQAARESNPYLADELVESVVEGKSYDKIYKKAWIAIEHESFYGYQRKMIYILYVYLDRRGYKWEDGVLEDAIRKTNV